jgi:hypothetical protein
MDLQRVDFGFQMMKSETPNLSHFTSVTHFREIVDQLKSAPTKLWNGDRLITWSRRFMKHMSSKELWISMGPSHTNQYGLGTCQGPKIPNTQ